MAIIIHIQNQGRKNMLRLSGRFDFASYRDFRVGYEEALRLNNPNEVEVDLGEVNYLDSSALGMLLILKEKAASNNQIISLVNCRGTVLQILEVANFHKLFTIRS